jgi:hypothetical protein
LSSLRILGHHTLAPITPSLHHSGTRVSPIVPHAAWLSRPQPPLVAPVLCARKAPTSSLCRSSTHAPPYCRPLAAPLSRSHSSLAVSASLQHLCPLSHSSLTASVSCPRSSLTVPGLCFGAPSSCRPRTRSRAIVPLQHPRAPFLSSLPHLSGAALEELPQHPHAVLRSSLAELSCRPCARPGALATYSSRCSSASTVMD